MKAMSGTLPWVAVLAVLGGVIWWLLSRDVSAGRWILAAVLAGHGLVHLMFVMPAPEPSADGPVWPFDMTKSWIGSGSLKGVGWVLAILTIVGFALAALAATGVVVPSGWWQPAVVSASVASAIMLTIFFDPQLVLGLLIDAVLVWVAIARLWVP